MIPESSSEKATKTTRIVPKQGLVVKYHGIESRSTVCFLNLHEYLLAKNGR